MFDVCYAEANEGRLGDAVVNISTTLVTLELVSAMFMSHKLEPQHIIGS